VGTSLPVSNPNSVDLPAPFGPTIAKGLGLGLGLELGLGSGLEFGLGLEFGYL
jgi:hypothetical protein